MAETRKKAEGEYFEYQGKPLVREDDTIVYGDLNYVLHGRRRPAGAG